MRACACAICSEVRPYFRARYGTTSAPSGPMSGLSSNGSTRSVAFTSGPRRASALSTDARPIAHHGQATSETKAISRGCGSIGITMHDRRVRKASTLSKAILAAVLLWITPVWVAANEIAGVVRGPKGPEAGVWVIAETNDLPTRFARIVVTDDQGRYLVPDLPKANYNVWVRGYGLVDSPKMHGVPGQTLDHTAVAAP